MGTEHLYDWATFYHEFAEKLLDFHQRQGELIEKLRECYERSALAIPSLFLKKEELSAIDPFTIYTLFNRNMTDANRTKLLTAIQNVFAIHAEVPEAFAGVPVAMNLNALFYDDVQDIPDLWNLFEQAWAYAVHPDTADVDLLADAFERAEEIKGNGVGKVTMGLFWMAADDFLSLDGCNLDYIYGKGSWKGLSLALPKRPGKKLSFGDYAVIMRTVRDFLEKQETPWNSFEELSVSAWKHAHDFEKNGDETGEKAQLVKEDVRDFGLPDMHVPTVRYWLYAPGRDAVKWREYHDAGVMGIGWGQIGDLSGFSSKEEMRQAMQEKIDPSKSWTVSALATWQFLKEMKPGDVVFVKKGMHQIIGRGIVDGAYRYDADASDEYNHVRKVRWTQDGQWELSSKVMKTLTDITPYTGLVEQIKALFPEEEEDEEDVIRHYPSYGKEAFLDEVYLDAAQYDTLVKLLSYKKNLILEGAPGVGKTFAAKRLAYSILGEINPEHVTMVQFHQSYTYEDFIEGFRPSETGTGFELRKGSFYKFCRKAADDEEHPYFFIIDEINRGNLSKIFGELFLLLESDKRGTELPLLYSDERFTVPPNVYLIGMMNTADRSLALLDYALRRRFAFFQMRPAFSSDGFRKYQQSLGSKRFDRLVDCVIALNQEIAEDDSLGEGFCIGHSYFCGCRSGEEARLFDVVEFELLPLLREYWFDQPEKIDEWSRRLRSAIS